ncbi:hypothetical protein K1719_044464 [Acacia pycnantha]|nr:hypothetical protein K1719_044464 [Acacia pycnantha]
MQRQKMGFREYVEALEEERQKIQVFSRELPLSLELVSQAWVGPKSQNVEVKVLIFSSSIQSDAFGSEKLKQYLMRNEARISLEEPQMLCLEIQISQMRHLGISC